MNIKRIEYLCASDKLYKVRRQLGYTPVVAAGICGVSVNEYMRMERLRDEQDIPETAVADSYREKLTKQAELARAHEQKTIDEGNIHKLKQQRKKKFKIGAEYTFKHTSRQGNFKIHRFDDPVLFIFAGYTEGANGVVMHIFRHATAGYTESFTYFQLQNYEILRV